MDPRDGGRYRVNTPAVAGQCLDGEVVIIHFESGCYYSADTLGAEIFALVEARRTAAEIVAAVARAHDRDHADAAPLVAAFLDRLLEEGLIVADAGHAPPDAAGCRLPAATRRLKPPALRKYSDLQDLLLLDPIHDAGAAGWPAAGA